MLSPQPTPATLYLLKRCKWAQKEELSKLEHVEVCPKAMDLTQAIAKRISSDGGGALIIDYGLDGVVSDSLQVCHFSNSANFMSHVTGQNGYIIRKGQNRFDRVGWTHQQTLAHFEFQKYSIYSKNVDKYYIYKT